MQHNTRSLTYTWYFLKARSCLGHKASLNKLKKVEILLSILSNHNSMKLEINYKKKAGKITNMQRLNHMLRRPPWVNDQSRGHGEGMRVWEGQGK